LDSNGLLERDGARDLLNADEGWPELQIKGERRTSVPSDRDGGVKFAQAVISQTIDGKWKVFVQSDNQVEDSFVGSFEDVIQTLREYSRRGWHRRSQT
jgi:hypothetical protein